MTLTPAFVGIDLAYAKNKILPVSVCTWQEGRLIPEPLRLLPITPPRGHGNAAILNSQQVIEFADNVATYVVGVCATLDLKPQRIAIDAPSAPCMEGHMRREAEKAMDRAGIGCFATPSAIGFDNILDKVRSHLDSGGPEDRIPFANMLWMLVGFQLYRRLSLLAPCIEVFPQATARVLGAGDIHKTKPGGVEAQLSKAAIYTSWPVEGGPGPRFEDIAFGPAHDRLDAYLSAWVAALEPDNRIAYGQPPGDVIWVPRLGKPDFDFIISPASVAKHPLKSRESKSNSEQEHRRVCPGCDYEFKRWPFGWDAHAAHRCAGLVARGHEERKKEFKRRFLLK